MKTKFPFVIPIIISFFSCNQQQEQTHANSYAPKVVEAKGYIVPKDSMAIPEVVPAGKPKVVRADKPTVIPISSNIQLAGIPKTVIAGTPKICTPGKDTFTLPKKVPAINRRFLAGIPEMLLVPEAVSKEKNPQNFSSFNKLHGLKAGAVLCTLQDKNGNIWFGTWEGGVSRYDGKYFTHFTQKEGLNSNNVWSIYEDRSGNLWFGTVFGGVSKYDGKTFTNFTEKEGLIENAVNCILEDSSGYMWFGTELGGVFRLDQDSKTFTHYTEKEGLLNNKVLDILEDRLGNIWFGTVGGVSRLDRDRKNFNNLTEKEGLSNNAVTSIFKDASGKLWFGTWGGGVSRLDLDGKTFTYFTEKEGLNSNNVQSIYEDKSGNIWFGTGGGVSKYNGRVFTHFTEEHGLANNFVYCILEDRSGGLWFGTEGGVSKYNGGTFTQFTDKEGLNNSGSGIFEDGSGNLWFGGTKYDGESFANFPQQGGPGNARSILQDSYGNLWFGCHFDGIYKYDGRSFTHFTRNEGLCSDEVTQILQDRSGNLWVTTGGTGGGVCRLDRDGKTFTHYTDKEGLSDSNVWCMFEDRSGNLWFGTNRGSSRLDRDGKTFTQFTEKEGLGGKTVSTITDDKAGNLWFGTDRGVSRLDRDGKSFTHFTEKEGLSSDDVSSIFEDRAGNIWIGTSVGLNKLSAKSLMQLSANSNTLAALFKSYTYEEGLLGTGCNTIFEDKNGTIWVSTSDRLTAYHPEGDKPDTLPPNIQLTGIALFNETIPWVNLEQKKDTNIVLGNGVNVAHLEFDSLTRWYNLPEHLSLAYNNNFLTFNFIGIATKSPHQVRYQYKLEGLDENWSILTNRNEAVYGNLPPDNYTFKVKAMNSDGYWSKEASYNFKIRPPWWRTWLAYTLYALGLVGAVSWFIAYRSRKLRLENKILEEKVTQRTIQLEQKSTELEKSLNDLKSAQAQLIHSEKMASLGELTAGIAHEIQNPLNFVNNFSDVNKELLSEMKMEMDKGNLEDARVIANDVIDNEEKISHHGKRADAIVKGMLQHSRTSSGQKELTNINALADEYLRLAYHGLRAKDKNFNAKFETNFDPAIKKINIVPQEMGRVLLNLINNAFYAVDEKKKQLGDGYEPTVIVSTKKNKDKIEITVADNGNGIPKKIADKIFQPFFTTKPTGQGTGLGLSLAYDIVKAHGGEIKVETKENVGSEFVLQLPLTPGV